MLRLLLERLSEGGKDIGQRHIRDVQALFGRQSGRRLSLPGGLEARRDFGQVVLRREAERAGEGVFTEEPSEAAVPARTLPGDRDLLEEIRGKRHRFGADPGTGTLEITLMRWEKTRGIEQKTYTKWLDYDRIKSLVLRTRRPGDYLAVNDRLQKKSLKAYLIQEKVPAAEREALPLLADGSHILWVIGHRISSAAKVTESTEKVLQIYLRGGKENG